MEGPTIIIPENEVEGSTIIIPENEVQGPTIIIEVKTHECVSKIF